MFLYVSMKIHLVFNLLHTDRNMGGWVTSQEVKGEAGKLKNKLPHLPTQTKLINVCVCILYLYYYYTLP